ncbi:MAG: DUF554 domain-containing protein [Actinomycetota bacterium]|nr:DUF554 domain-containing protein [Actinomycetota bacterium]
MIGAVHLTGTLINAGTVLVGTAVGTLLGDRLPERIRETVMHALGLFVLAVGVDESLAAFTPPLSRFTRASVVIVLGSVLVGGIVGELLRIEDRLNTAGEALKRRFGRGQARFTEGFVVASLVFCVGPLSILGSIQDGLNGDYQLLAIKSTLDGFAALAFSAALGWGVGFSAITILLYQGSLSLAASAVAGSFTPEITAALTAAGGILILGISLRLLDLKQVRVANLLPALVLAPATVAVMQALR